VAVSDVQIAPMNSSPYAASASETRTRNTPTATRARGTRAFCQAASGNDRARLSACARRASITRSACSRTRSRPRTRSGASPYRGNPDLTRGQTARAGGKRVCARRARRGTAAERRRYGDAALGVSETGKWGKDRSGSPLERFLKGGAVDELWRRLRPRVPSPPTLSRAWAHRRPHSFAQEPLDLADFFLRAQWHSPGSCGARLPLSAGGNLSLRRSLVLAFAVLALVTPVTRGRPP
jgi:hypothetical protein